MQSQSDIFSRYEFPVKKKKKYILHVNITDVYKNLFSTFGLTVNDSSG